MSNSDPNGRRTWKKALELVKQCLSLFKQCLSLFSRMTPAHLVALMAVASLAVAGMSLYVVLAIVT